MPSQPHTTLGMPTKISRAGWTIARAQRGATSERKSARPTDRGVEMASATTVTKTVPAMNGNRPKITWPFAGSGCHVDDRIWSTGTPLTRNSCRPCQVMKTSSRATTATMEDAAMKTIRRGRSTRSRSPGVALRLERRVAAAS